ncbi:4-hydroxybenzoate polyprenyltransferase [Rubidibacter lacunae KORDI 51-2]|uniref:4-hydroxybenzoate polyprenyltransferase n=1 Tax=Rubidibacter lacunae KORDI 51-2 TaxID=582515 RepID=U5DR62_9CHRO|nr:decaprenyl-phosphate phosphoribosyltransferase [Rubidibacter lacunae]ERN42180.1 4-hydroxybenzoate polyprenyltransferase [Rubidibacter lacunae KORDI 51-2]
MASKQVGWQPYIAVLRPHQWTKNLIVFAAPLFSFSISWGIFLKGTVAFCLFCVTASSFYIFNDTLDVKADRRHPVKCKRPIASGAVHLKIVVGMAAVLLAGSILTAWWQSPVLGATLSGYAVLQVAYNLKLKRTAILDVGAIAAGFVLRAYAGAAATEIALSPWFVLCTAMLALFLGIEKRKAELLLVERTGQKGRSVLSRYSKELLARMENTVTTSTLLTYSLWSAGPVVNGAPTAWMMLTVPFVLYGIFRYQLLSETHAEYLREQPESASRQTEHPEEVLLKDMPVFLTVTGWVVACATILWLDHRGIV